MNNQYKKLSIKEITGNITSSEKQSLYSWLADSDENKKEYEKLKEIWAAFDSSQVPGSINIDMEWAKLNERLQNSGRQNVKESFMEKLLSYQGTLRPKLRPVLAAIFILCIAAIGIYFLNKDVPKPLLTLVKTSNTEYKNVTLPDGSIVYLNSGSSIEFFVKSEGDKKVFNNNERKILLNGEAFFSVTKNDKPFIITTENAKITVLGTKFDVLSRNENTRVVVKEGKVNFSPKDIKTEGIYLTKDQLSTIRNNSGPSSPKEVDAHYFLGWMEGSLIFYKTPINEVAKDLERHYNINITLQGDSLNEYTLTGSFKNSNADSALSIVCLALGLDFEKQNNNYVIKTKNIIQ
jgi:transmembrane sensor